jgi:hypothetical protein
VKKLEKGKNAPAEAADEIVRAVRDLAAALHD